VNVQKYQKIIVINKSVSDNGNLNYDINFKICVNSRNIDGDHF